MLGLTCSNAETARARVWWRHSERTLRAIGARYELHRLLLLRLQAGDVPAALVPAVLQELLTGVARMHHEPLFLVFERARGAGVLETALRLDVERDFAGSLLGRLGDEAVPALERLSREPGLADLCVCLLGQIGGDAALQALSHLRDATTKTGRAALRAWEDLSSNPEDPLRIAALGPLRISVGARELTAGAWQSKRALLLFLILLLRRFRWVPTDEIIEALWPGVDADKGRNNLVQSVHLLRRTLQPGLRQARLSRYVLSRQDACRLEPGRGFVYDVQQFEEALACAQKEERAGHPDRAEKCLRQAIELYEGDLLEERPYEEILAEERERMRERMLGAVARLLDLLAGSRRWGDVLPLCTLGLARDPCREGFHAYLIQARLAGGDRSGALEGYHQYEKTVRRELGVAPSVRMQTLARRITEARP